MSIQGPKIVYGGGPTTLQFSLAGHGLNDFAAFYRSRHHDNIAVSGIKERVFEHNDLFVAFTLPALRLTSDMANWQTFVDFASDGSQFDFYADASINGSKFHCTLESEWAPKRVAPERYSASFEFRVVPDNLLPTPYNILGWLNGHS